jgi:hypothetical protein
MAGGAVLHRLAQRDAMRKALQSPDNARRLTADGVEWLVYELPPSLDRRSTPHSCSKAIKPYGACVTILSAGVR